MKVSYRTISAGSTIKEWFLYISNSSHNRHEMVSDLLSYITHLQYQLEVENVIGASNNSLSY
jgi:hypothetical protein